jgi:hypothetical protein
MDIIISIMISVSYIDQFKKTKKLNYWHNNCCHNVVFYARRHLTIILKRRWSWGLYVDTI